MFIWLTKLLLAHLLTDFVLQPRSWVEARQRRHFAAPALYLHGAVTAVVAWALVGWPHWGVALAIFGTHTLIDGWKSYRPEAVRWFLIDQGLHLLVLLGCWAAVFRPGAFLEEQWQALNIHPAFWASLTAVIFLTFPCSILIGQLTRAWRQQLPDADTLASAGKWIGIIERLIILLLVLPGQFEAIGLLIAAKTILRFNEQNRPEIKTEYLVIGTLISLSLALGTGLLVRTVI